MRYREFVEHIGEDDLEHYAMQTVAEAELALFEEHLLICQQCRARLESLERYVQAMRAAAARIRDSGTDE